jgi:MSHA biogenesis protein MshM
MYLNHFGLKEAPFSITPDTSFYFASPNYKIGLNTLLFAILSGEGFIKITGEVGTGKTLLCRKLMHCLNNNFKVAYVPNPYLEPKSLLMVLAQELGIALPTDATEHVLLNALTNGLLAFARNNTKVVVCLDEVQAMPIETLEALRLLSNLETEKRKLLQVVIFGQPELEAKLNHASIRQLKQRISFEYRLSRLTRDETQFYLNHRLAIAGHLGGRMFTSAALALLYLKSKGTPRLINILSHKALLTSYGKGKHQVGLKEMYAAVCDTQSVATFWKRLSLHSFSLSIVMGIFISMFSGILLVYPN